MKKKAIISGDFDDNILWFQSCHRSRDHETFISP
jgi:hypothetical protein